MASPDVYTLVVQAVNKLKVRSCLIDGEAVCCNEHGVPCFEKLRHRSNDQGVILIAFDLLGGICHDASADSAL